VFERSGIINAHENVKLRLNLRVQDSLPDLRNLLSCWRSNQLISISSGSKFSPIDTVLNSVEVYEPEISNKTELHEYIYILLH
jgi:hypothetical protein